MELLFAVLGGLICGGIAHVAMPWRAERGVVLAPAVGGIVAAIVWEVLSWVGWSYGGTWIWVAALVAAGAVAFAAAWAIGPVRAKSDAVFFAEAKASGV